jgi:hypothetical protein
VLDGLLSCCSYCTIRDRSYSQKAFFLRCDSQLAGGSSSGYLFFGHYGILVKLVDLPALSCCCLALVYNRVGVLTLNFLEFYRHPSAHLRDVASIQNQYFGTLSLKFSLSKINVYAVYF